MDKLYDHQHEVLKTLLSEPEYRKLKAKEAFEKARTNDELYRIQILSFTSQKSVAVLSEKALAAGSYVILDDEYVEKFKGGVPGFPNKLKREWFDRAWSEVKR